MATNFPTAFDVIPDPGALTGTADSGFFHDVLHANTNDSIYAIEQKLGVTGSAVTSTVDYILHGHQHLGTDGSSLLPISNHQPAVDGVVQNLLTAAGVPVTTVTTATGAVATFSIFPVSGSVVGLLVKSPTGTLTADLTQWQNNAGGVLAGVSSTGGMYTTGALTLYRGVGGTVYLSTVPTSGEIDFQSGPLLKGFSGASTGQQWQLDSAQGIMSLGGPSGNPSLVLNNWHINRTSELQLWGKDNADSGLTSFGMLADADGAVLTARSMLLRGNLGKTATGVLIGVDNFLALSYPTYDGVTTYTKAAGVSVLPATAPPLTAGQFGIAGALNVTGNTTLGGSLSVTGTTTFASLSLTTLTVSGTSSLGALTATSVSAPALTASGLSGATNQTRLGGRTAGGPPTTGTWAVGDIVTDANGVTWTCITAGTPGSWSSATTALHYRCRMFRSAAYTPGTAGVSTTVPYDTDSYDPANMSNTATGQVTCPFAGIYDTRAVVSGSGTGAAGQRFILSVYNGSTEVARGTDFTVPAAYFWSVSVSSEILCAANDILTVRLFQSTAAAVQPGTAFCYFNVTLRATP